MPYYLIIIYLLITSCGQSFNSNFSDDTLLVAPGSIDTSTPLGQKFSAAYNGVIQPRCISCHSGDHNDYSTYTSPSDWLDFALVTANDFSNSLIIRKLKNYGGDMPSGGGALTSAEINLLQEWIEAY